MIHFGHSHFLKTARLVRERVQRGHMAAMKDELELHRACTAIVVVGLYLGAEESTVNGRKDSAPDQVGLKLCRSRSYQ